MNIPSQFKNNSSYQKRIKQRHNFFFIGTRLVIVGALLFVGGLLLLLLRVPFGGSPSLIGLGLIATIFGSIFSIIFGIVGWSKNKWIDMLLNKLSAFLSLLGFVVWICSEIVRSDDFLIIGLLLIIVGVILAVPGIKFHSAID